MFVTVQGKGWFRIEFYFSLVNFNLYVQGPTIIFKGGGCRSHANRLVEYKHYKIVLLCRPTQKIFERQAH